MGMGQEVSSKIRVELISSLGESHSYRCSKFNESYLFLCAPRLDTSHGEEAVYKVATRLPR
jgi:hypothetical protein